MLPRIPPCHSLCIRPHLRGTHQPDPAATGKTCQLLHLYDSRLRKRAPVLLLAIWQYATARWYVGVACLATLPLWQFCAQRARHEAGCVLHHTETLVLLLHVDTRLACHPVACASSAAKHHSTHKCCSLQCCNGAESQNGTRSPSFAKHSSSEMCQRHTCGDCAAHDAPAHRMLACIAAQILAMGRMSSGFSICTLMFSMPACTIRKHYLKVGLNCCHVDDGLDIAVHSSCNAAVLRPGFAPPLAQPHVFICRCVQLRLHSQEAGLAAQCRWWRRRCRTSRSVISGATTIVAQPSFGHSARGRNETYTSTKRVVCLQARLIVESS